MLITAGNINYFNTMTAIWGSLGYMWARPVASCVIRLQRWTYKFVEENQFFTLSFFPPEYKSALEICGKYSGRDLNKVEMAYLTPRGD